MAVLNPGSVFDTYNFEVPCEGAKVIPLLLDFSANAEYDVDLSMFEQQAQISMLQGIFIDNSASTTAMLVTIDANGLNQAVVANPNTQGYYSVLAPNPTRLSFVSSSGIVQRVHLYNVPIAGTVWAATHP